MTQLENHRKYISVPDVHDTTMILKKKFFIFVSIPTLYLGDPGLTYRSAILRFCVFIQSPGTNTPNTHNFQIIQHYTTLVAEAQTHPIISSP